MRKIPSAFRFTFGVALATPKGNTRAHWLGQVQPLIVSLIRVTAPVLANNLPVRVTPVGPGLLSEIDVVARMFPSKVGPFRVAELPTCQKTLHGLPMLVMTTVLRGFVVNDDAIWKIQTAFGLPCPSRVRTPVLNPDGDDIKKVPSAELYAPAKSVLPPNSEAMVCGAGLLAALIAMVKMFWPLCALALVMSLKPVTTPEVGGPSKPVTEVPGNNPRFPLTLVGPFVLSLVTVELPKTA